MLPWLGGGGFNFTDMMIYLENYGFFAYVLPFLIVFALVFAILSTMKMFQDNKGASVIIALAVGFLSLVGGFVPTFFSTIFPRFGVGISIILVALLLAGTFISGTEDKKYFKWIFFGLGALVFLFVLFSSFADWSFYGAGNWRYWWDNYAGIILLILVLIGVIVAVTVGQKKGAANGS